MRCEIKLLPGELWWGALVNHGLSQPFGHQSFTWDLADNSNNQAAPLLLSTKGRWVWSERRFRFGINEGRLNVEGIAKLQRGTAPARTLRDAFLAASTRFFPPAGRVPPAPFFTAPQYNTWIEMLYTPTQQGILKYARDLIRHGFPPGVLMIDSGWHGPYGDWEFNRLTFPDPRAMVAELHRLGFRVMLWVIPLASPDQARFRELRDAGALVKDSAGEPVIRKWWDGHSAVLDLTGGPGLAWFTARLKYLQSEYGVDGFKFDGGDFYFFQDGDVTAVPSDLNDQAEAYARVGLAFPYNEFRACWKLGGQPLVHRLWDKNHSWAKNGLNTLIPYSITQGLLGHPFICPDMIGGGEYLDHLANQHQLDAELIVRNAQCAALMPMMQFSMAPWRVLGRRHLALVREAAGLHTAFGPRLLRLARDAARTGEPILRSLDYNHPGLGYETITDQFMLGEKLLVAPVLTKGALTRRVVFPPGKWRGDDRSVVTGPVELEIAAPLARLPRYERMG